jgi:hypothetical protein
MSDLATVSPTYGLTRTLEPPRGDINGFLRPGMGIIRRGALMGRRAGSRLLEPVLDASARSDLEILGSLDMDTIPAFTTAGSNGEALDGDGLPVQVVLRDGPQGKYDTGTSTNAITISHLGLPCFAKNDNTLWLTDNGGTLSFAGIVSGISANGKVEFATDWRIRSMWKLTRSALELANLTLDEPTELTIATGAVTVTQSYHTIDTEADAASDDLVTISGSLAGQLYLVKPSNDARSVVIKHASGNIFCPHAKDITLAETDDYALLISDGTNLTVIGYSTLAENGGGAGAMVGLLPSLNTTNKTSVVAAINELHTSLTTTQGVIDLKPSDFYLLTGAPLAIFANGASAVPGSALVDSKAFGIRWNNNGTLDGVVTSFLVPPDADITANMTLTIRASKTGATLADAVTFAVGAFNQVVGALHDADADFGGTSSAMTGDAAAKTIQAVTLTLALANLAAYPASVTLTVKPTDGTLGTDDLVIHSVSIAYKKKILTS